MDRPAYPDAMIIGHPNITHAAAIEIARREGLRIVQTKRGNYIYKPAAPCGISRIGATPSSVGRADAAGHLEAA